MKPKVARYKLDDPELLELVSPEMDRWLNSWSAEEQARYGGQGSSWLNSKLNRRLT